MSKHTYLYPLPASARFLWMLGRTDPADLFGDPDLGHGAGWLTTVDLADTFAHARAVVMRLINDKPRVCIGHGYTIPDSQVGAEYHDTHETTRLITRRLWDGETVTQHTHRYVMGYVNSHPVLPGRDSADDIDNFLTQHMGQLIIPVWM